MGSECGSQPEAGGTVMKEKCTAIVAGCWQWKADGYQDPETVSGYLRISGALLRFKNVFQDSPLIDEVILVAGERDIEYCRSDIVGKYHFTKIKKIVAGGKERYDSVYVGLKKLPRLRLCFLSMTARGPLWREEILQQALQTVQACGACVAAVSLKRYR